MYFVCKAQKWSKKQREHESFEHGSLKQVFMRLSIYFSLEEAA